MIRITHAIAIAEQELKEAFLRASGPGGQNVNKLETAVQLRFAAMASPNLPDWARAATLNSAKYPSRRRGMDYSLDCRQSASILNAALVIFSQ